MYRSTMTETDLKSEGTVHMEKCPEELTGVSYRPPIRISHTMFSLFVFGETENTGLVISV